MLLRILTAAVLIPAVVALVWWGPSALLAAAAAGVALLALAEFFTLGDRMGLRGFRKWAMTCAAGLFYAQYSLGLVERHALAGGVSIVRDAAGGHRELTGPLDSWHRIAKKAAWRNLIDVRRTFPSADAVDEFTVFNIKGNSYRLITEINYPTGRIFLRHVLTHAEYGKGGWRN